MTTSPIIEAAGLTKRFTVKKATVEAVTDLTFQVAQGELVAFLGPNGAGKSTSLRMLTTLIPPTSGTATVVGHDILNDPSGVRARIGYVGQLTSGSFSQRVRDELLSQGAFYGMAPGGCGTSRRRAHRVARPRRASPPARCSSSAAARSAASTWRSGSCTRLPCCSSTSRRRVSTRRAAPTSGSTS